MAYDKYNATLVSLAEVLLKYALEEQKDKNNSPEGEARIFSEGILFGYNRSITIMQQLADANDIPLEELGLENITENDLM
jgi:hypothetical protein